MSKTRLYRITRATPDQYVWHNRLPALVIENRQHNWVLIMVDGSIQIVPLHELRQCKCEFAGRWHKHAGEQRA